MIADTQGSTLNNIGIVSMTLIIVVGVAVTIFIILGLLAILCSLTKKDNVAQVVPLTSERTEV